MCEWPYTIAIIKKCDSVHSTPMAFCVWKTIQNEKQKEINEWKKRCVNEPQPITLSAFSAFRQFISIEVFNGYSFLHAYLGFYVRA